MQDQRDFQKVEEKPDNNQKNGEKMREEVEKEGKKEELKNGMKIKMKDGKKNGEVEQKKEGHLKVPSTIEIDMQVVHFLKLSIHLRIKVLQAL